MQDDHPLPKGGQAASGLPRDIQEHLGRRLRTELGTETGKPGFLGEASVPPELEPLVRKLEAGEQGERQGYEAVKRALLGAETSQPGVEMPTASAGAPLRPRIPKRPV